MHNSVLSEKKRDNNDVKALYDQVMRHLVSNTGASCPVDTASAFLRLFQSESCGKCVPCRIGLSVLQELLEDILDGRATKKILKLIEETAKDIKNTADCAIGKEAADFVLKSIKAFGDEYISHIENSRCLCEYSEAVPCVAFCPAHVDIPGYIALVNEKKYSDAVKLIKKDNPFPSACALICEHPCELHCRRNMIDDSVNIKALKRMAVDNAKSVNPSEIATKTGKTVAVIGGGPSGLTAAYYLSLMGHDVTVFDKRKKLGGMLRYGIPSYRLPRETLDAEIESILSTGIKTVLDTEIGKDITFEQIKKDFDGVYLSIGAHSDNRLRIEGEDGNGVISAVALLRSVGDGELPDFSGKNVVVVGGGNVAMDCTRSAIRLGAKSVVCAYRRRRDDMTALQNEIEGAIEEGAVLKTLSAPQKIELDGKGNVAALWLKPQIISLVQNGRPSVKDACSDSERIPADIIIVAIGQKIESEYFEGCNMVVNRGRFVVDNKGNAQNNSGIFCGGDCVTGPSSAIKAIAAGKVAAGEIDRYLGFSHEISSDVEIPAPKLGIYPPCGRINLSERLGNERKFDFCLIENKMTEQEAAQESSRCLRCDKYGYGMFKGGRENKW